MKIDLKFLQTNEPLFLVDANMNKKIEAKKYSGMRIYWDVALDKAIILYKGAVAIIPMHNTVKMEPVNAADLNIEAIGIAPKPVITHINHPIQVPTMVAATAQVWEPTNNPTLLQQPVVTKNPTQELVTLTGKRKPRSRAELVPEEPLK